VLRSIVRPCSTSSHVHTRGQCSMATCIAFLRSSFETMTLPWRRCILILITMKSHILQSTKLPHNRMYIKRLVIRTHNCKSWSNLHFPLEQQGLVLFLCGHMSGSWVSAVGAKYGIVPEFFRRHMHLWRSLEGSVLYAVPRLLSAACRGLSP